MRANRNSHVAISRFICIVSLILVGILLSPFSQCLAEKKLVFKNLTEEIGRGFGSTWNRYAWSMEFDDHLYVGTWSNQTDWPAMFEAIANGELLDIFSGGENPLALIGFIASEGGEIWRHDGGQNWTRVKKAEPSITGFRKMIKYKGKLYAGTANEEKGAELWVKTITPSTSTGEQWVAVEWPGKSPENNSIRALCVFADPDNDYEETLYVGTENNEDGGELWAFYADENGSEWELKEKFEKAEVHSVAEIAALDGVLYVGTWKFEFDLLGGVPSDTFQLYKSDDGEDFEKVKPEFEGRENLNNVGVMKLIVYRDRLYLGTVNYIDGFTLLSSATPSVTNSWKVHTTDGFGNSDNAYFWSAVVVDDILIAGTFNSGISGGVFPVLPMDGRAQILYTKDGDNFITLVDDGFGVPFTYGIRSMVASDNQLFVATASNVLIPDFQSSLYDSVQIEQLLETVFDVLDSSYVQIAPYLLEGLSNLYFPSYDGPFIGTQVWASPTGKPGKGNSK